MPVQALGGGPEEWVAEGEATILNRTGNWYFYETCFGSAGNIVTPIYQPPSGDVNNYFQYQIFQSGGDYYMQGYNDSGTLEWDTIFSTQGTEAQDIEIGLETTNNSYSVTHSQEAYFTHNQWEATSNGRWYYQTGGDGNPVIFNPPTFTWIIHPKQQPGGFADTTCC